MPHRPVIPRVLNEARPVFQLRILGPLQVTDSDGRDVEAIARQSKRAALLAYLAAARPRGPQRRDKLVALFWPESDEVHARAALNQALYVLRTVLGEDAIPARGDGAVAINERVVWCDAVAFEAALESGRPAEALGLYRADLLDGFFVSGAPEFERWLEEERERLRQRACEGAWALAEAKAAKGETHEAARWAKRAADSLPTDEAAVRRLMIFLHGLGDRVAAIRAYEAFAWRLAQEYELEPSAETEALAAAIREAEQQTTDIHPVLPPPPSRVRATAQRKRSVGRFMLSAIAATALATAAWASLRAPRSPPPAVARFALAFGGVPPLASGITGSTLALSPDGAQLVYVGEGPQGPELFVRRMDRLEALPISSTRGATLPFFSPDGTWLGFIVGNAIRKVSLAGGPAITVCKVSAKVAGASWSSNNIIIFATAAGLWQVPAGGGEAKILAVADTAHGVRYRWAAVLPGDHAAAFTLVDSTGLHLALVSLQTGAVERLGVEGTDPRFVTPGYLVFARMDGVLLAAPFDAKTLRLTGAAIPITDGVLVGNAGAAKMGLSRNGALAYVPELSAGSLVVVDRTGRTAAVPAAPRGIGGGPRFSPDGRRLTISVKPPGGQPDIWMIDLMANTLRRVTFDSGSTAAEWSPDGRRIAFGTQSAGRNIGLAIRQVAADASEAPVSLLPSEIRQVPRAFTPDGKSLVFERWNVDTDGDLWILPLDGARIPRPYLQGQADEQSAVLSRDGRWLAYVSDESGEDEVYVRPFLDVAPPVQISVGGGREPRWGSSARELFYRSSQGMIAAAIHVASPLRVDTRRVLFDDRPYLAWRIGAAYDVHPDGEHFAMVRRGSDGRDVIIVLNWFDQLRSASR